jgi:hypothetical protein
MTNISVDETTLAALLHRIEALPAKPCTSPADVIATLLPALDAARARGVPLTELLRLLNDVGITLSAKTVRDYMSRARRAGARAAGSPVRFTSTDGPIQSNAAPMAATSTHSPRRHKQRAVTPTFREDHR